LFYPEKTTEAKKEKYSHKHFFIFHSFLFFHFNYREGPPGKLAEAFDILSGKNGFRDKVK